MKPGDFIRRRIDEAIRVYDKLLLILSEDSVTSSWVEFEVEAALDKEKQRASHNVLFPLRIDNAIFTCSTPWATHLKRTRHIGNFERWKDHDMYQQAFQKLLKDLKEEK